MKPLASTAVAPSFGACPPDMRRNLLALRDLIFRTAALTDGVGELEEALKWGDPACLTSASGSGSTVRIAWKESRPTKSAMHFNGQTTLVETFKTLFPDEFRFEGNRAIALEASQALSTDALAFCIAAALTRAGRHTQASSFAVGPHHTLPVLL